MVLSLLIGIILTSSRSLLVTDMHGDKSWCQFPGAEMRFYNVKTTRRLLLLQKGDFTFHSHRRMETDGTLTHFTGSSATESWTERNRNRRDRKESVKNKFEKHGKTVQTKLETFHNRHSTRSVARRLQQQCVAGEMTSNWSRGPIETVSLLSFIVY